MDKTQWRLAAAIVVLAALLGGLIGYAAYSISWTTGTNVTCVTKGATLLSKNSKDGKYLTFWCVKGGKIVP